MSPAFSALVWWLIPLAAVLGALGYVLWVTKFQERFRNETTRSVSQFQRFQSSFRAEAHDESSEDHSSEDHSSEDHRAPEKEITKPNE
ncbi:MAG: hypothetical protein HY050_08670 [Actinobacteria bacterium]|nr:hypothetical protein [Actinomycetota bacterium]